MNTRWQHILGGLSAIGATVALGAATTPAAATTLPCFSPGQLMQSTATTLLTVSNAHRKSGRRTIRPGYYVCTKGHPWHWIAQHNPSSYNETLHAQLTDKYIGFSLNAGDSHSSSGVYVRSVALASGKSVTFRQNDLSPGILPGSNYYLSYGQPLLTSVGTLYFPTGAYTGAYLDVKGPSYLLSLNRQGGYTILDQGDIDLLALRDATISTPGHVYWTKDGVTQSAVIAPIPRPGTYVEKPTSYTARSRRS